MAAAGREGEARVRRVQLGEPLAALDCANPDVLAWLAALMRKVRAWGFGYAKLDFLYAGALPGVRGSGVPREAAYREALRVMREAIGDAYLLVCGAPVVPSVGLCDALRVGPDVARGVGRAPRQPAARQPCHSRCPKRGADHGAPWLARLFHVDPDVAYFRAHRCAIGAEEKPMAWPVSVPVERTIRVGKLPPQGGNDRGRRCDLTYGDGMDPYSADGP